MLRTSMRLWAGFWLGVPFSAQGDQNEARTGWDDILKEAGRTGMPATPWMRGSQGRPGRLAHVCGSAEFP